MNDVLRTIANRRSIRRFKDKVIDEATIVLLLKAGMAAPSADNCQPWEFIAVTERRTLERIAEVHSGAEMLCHAPLCICVCGNLHTYEDATEIWVQDCSAATENILLAAEALGLGAVWCGAYPGGNTAADMREVLGLPSHVTPLNAIAVGYPNEDPPVKDKWREDRVHWQRW